MLDVSRDSLLRLETMANDEELLMYDLSPNDRLAIRQVLHHREELIAKVEQLTEPDAGINRSTELGK